MFRMLGNKVELIRYKISYIENELERQEKCISENHKNEIEKRLKDKGIKFVTTPIDQSKNEWFNGLNFNSRDEALAVLDKGELSYTQEVLKLQATDTLKLRGDIEYLAMATGVEL